MYSPLNGTDRDLLPTFRYWKAAFQIQLFECVCLHCYVSIAPTRGLTSSGRVYDATSVKDFVIHCLP
ncbi:hypothetical protein T09_13517 [Trichinella sp. T9]|nr:hypothetical protein T09_13517 [Trichinella sp. T9]